jgi:hypothetical protein
MLHFQQNDEFLAEPRSNPKGTRHEWQAASALWMKPDEALVLPIADENVADTSVVQSKKRESGR